MRPFACPLHGGGTKGSVLALEAYDIIQQVAEGCDVVVEAAVLAGHGAFDFWVRQAGLLVEVDGHSHDSYAFHQRGTDAQSARDSSKEKAAVRAGFHVLRLHWGDTGAWARTVARALSVSGRIPLARGEPCITYSQSPPALTL